MLGKKTISLCLLVLAAVLLLGRTGSANTITLHDDYALSDYSAGVFAYDVTFDAFNILNDNDGFVLYDFKDETGFTFTPVSGTWTLSQPLASNTLESSALVDTEVHSLANVEGIAYDNPKVPNLVFTYSGSADNTADANTIAVLTVYTSVTTFTEGIYGSVDQQKNVSKSGKVSYSDSLSINNVTVPNPAVTVPFPAAGIAGAVLLGLIGLARIGKSKMAA